MGKVAENILEEPSNSSYKVICDAARYLAEILPLNLPPLLEEEKSLGLEFGVG